MDHEFPYGDFEQNGIEVMRPGDPRLVTALGGPEPTFVELGASEVDAVTGWLADRNNGPGDGLEVFDLAGTAVRFTRSEGGRLVIRVGDSPSESHRP